MSYSWLTSNVPLKKDFLVIGDHNNPISEIAKLANIDIDEIFVGFNDSLRRYYY